MSGPATVTYVGDLDHGHVELIDQTLLPNELRILRLTELEQVFDAIRRLAVRGAPAIGIAAAFGLVLGVRRSPATSPPELLRDVHAAADRLAESRPTAVNLFWALDRQRATAEKLAPRGCAELREGLLAEARAILEEDRAMCRAMGRIGSALVADGDGLLTHCNAGGLATAAYGTALAVFYAASEAGKRIAVFADETRPLLQGARLTTWELMQAGIDVTLICDNTAAQVMAEGRIQKVFVGSDRIARNGDVANKIGTYGVALLAAAHGIPFYVVAPTTTFDLECPDGGAIPIEERAAEEVTEGFGRRTAPPGVKVYSPAFDVTPARLVTGIVTEKGLIQPVNEANLVRVVTGP